MKSIRKFGLAGLITISLLASILMPVIGKSAPVSAESAFERVIASGKLRCGYSVWPPYFIKDPNTNQLSGINYDQTEAIARQLDLKVEWVSEIGFGEVSSALNSGKIDMMCASLWPDAARLKLLALTRPLFFTPTYVYVRADDNRFDGGDSLNRDTVRFVGIEGDVTYNAARNSFPNAKLLALPQNADPAQLLLNLTGKKADAVIIDEAFAADFIKNNPGKIKKLSITGAVQIYSESFGLRQGELQLKNMVDAAIENIINNGQSKIILSRYQNYSFAPKPGF